MGFLIRTTTGIDVDVQRLFGLKTVADGTFHHVVATRDMEASTMNLYVDGRLEASAALLPAARGPIVNADGEIDPVIIGARTLSGSTTELDQYFAGTIDEVAYYERALTRCEAWFAFKAGAAGHCKPTVDTDGDTVVDFEDNCPADQNSTQDDQDSDLMGDACDCAGSDPSAALRPEEIDTLSSAPDKETLTWCATPPLSGIGTVHDVPRGSLDEFAVGMGGAEICLAPGSFPTGTAIDSTPPDAGEGFWYLVRGRNACGTATYGFERHLSGPIERFPNVCP